MRTPTCYKCESILKAKGNKISFTYSPDIRGVQGIKNRPEAFLAKMPITSDTDLFSDPDGILRLLVLTMHQDGGGTTCEKIPNLAYEATRFTPVNRVLVLGGKFWEDWNAGREWYKAAVQKCGYTLPPGKTWDAVLVKDFNAWIDLRL